MTPVRATAKNTSAEEDRSQLQVTVIQDPLLLGTNTTPLGWRSLNPPRFSFSYARSTLDDLYRENRGSANRL